MALSNQHIFYSRDDPKTPVKIDYVDDEKAEAAEARKQVYKLAAGEGLSLKVMPTGSKMWSLKFRLTGKEKSVTLGRFPQVKLADAKALAHKAKEMLKNGRNPTVERARGKLV